MLSMISIQSKRFSARICALVIVSVYTVDVDAVVAAAADSDAGADAVVHVDSTAGARVRTCHRTTGRIVVSNEMVKKDSEINLLLDPIIGISYAGPPCWNATPESG